MNNLLMKIESDLSMKGNLGTERMFQGLSTSIIF